MKATLLVALAVLPSVASAQQRVDQRWPSQATGSIRIYNMIGSTRVVGWDKDTVWATGTVAPGGGRFFMAGGPNVKVGVDAPDRPDAPPTDLVIYVPHASRVFVKAATANVTTDGVTGGVDISTVTGSVMVTGTMQQLNVETMVGNVTLDASASWMRAHTASGDITLKGGSEDLGVNTVSGTVLIAGTKQAFQRLHVESVTGDVTFSGDVASDATLEFETHSGNVDLNLPPDLAGGFNASTLEGAIVNEFGHGDGAVTHTVRGAEASFTVGDAGAEIRVRSFKGNVALKRRKTT